MEGWIKLHRKILEWEWYDDHNTFRLFIHCLLRANHKPKKWRGKQIDRGQFITSLSHLSQELSGRHSKLSVRQVRTSLDKLILTGELTNNSTNKYRLITVNNYSLHQVNDKQADKQVTSKRQTNDKQMTTNKKGKKVRMKETDIYSSSFNSFWNDYPRKIGKRKAFGIWKQRGLAKYLPEMLEFIKSAAKTKQWSDGFIPYPATFLNGNRWEDDLESLGKQREVVSVR